MKNLIGTLAIGMTLLGSNGARADEIPANQKYLQAPLTQFTLDPQLHTFGSPVGGNIIIDHTKNTATLTVYLHFYCPPGRLCMQIVPAPLIVELPIVSTTSDSAGEVITARQDLRTTDGDLEELIIREQNTDSAQPATSIEYMTEGFNPSTHAPQTTRSVFEGTRLQQVRFE